MKEKIENQLSQDETVDIKTIQGRSSELSNIKKTISDYKKTIDKVASFDSELSLVKKKHYDLNMWLPNPYYIGFRNQDIEIKRSEVLMTSRLDGANAKVVKRIIILICGCQIHITLGLETRILISNVLKF